MVDYRSSKTVTPTRFRPRRSTTLPVPASSAARPPMGPPAVGSRSDPISSPTSPPRAALDAGDRTGSPSAPHVATDDATHHVLLSLNEGNLPREREREREREKERERERERDRERDRSDSGNGARSSGSSSSEQIASLQRELERLSQVECEMSSFWRAKHGALHQQFLQAEAGLRVLRSDLGARREHEAAAAADRAELEALRGELIAREDEARALRAQVRGLKEWVSTSTRAQGQTSDEAFAEDVARLANGLQNWVIVNFRRARIDASRAGHEIRNEVSRLVPCFEALAPSWKLQLLQSAVSSILADAVFNAYFIGLTEEQTRQFRQMEDLISSLTSSPESANHWRAATLTMLRRDGPAANMQPETDRTIDSVVLRINRILDAVTVSSSSSSSDMPAAATTWMPSSSPTSSTAATVDGPTSTLSAAAPRDARVLRALVASATDLARQLASQRAVFSMHVPVHGAAFDASTMEDVGGEDDDALADRKVQCVVFPGVIKRGDERGAQLHFENVVAKARVLLCPEG